MSQHEFEEIDRSARRRRADVAAEDQGSDRRGCGDGAREASESGIRREYADGHRTFPKDGPGVVGAVLPKDLPASVDGPRGEGPLLVSPRSRAVFPAGRVTTRVRRDRSKHATKTRGRHRRGPRKRQARVRGRRAGSKRERHPLSLALSARRRRRSILSFRKPPIRGSVTNCVVYFGDPSHRSVGLKWARRAGGSETVAKS